MQIGIFSDIHDNVWKLHDALETMKDCDALVCCGDLCSPFIIGLIGERFNKGPVYIVFGNNDGDLYRITQNASRFTQIRLGGEFLSFEMDGRKIAVNHYPEIAREIAKNKKYDLVCYGHNHIADKREEGKTILLNPGTVMGYNPATKTTIGSTVAIYDTGLNTVSFKELS